MPANRPPNWTRAELIIALEFYFKIPFGKYDSSNPRVISLADQLGRTPGALAYKLGNFVSFDAKHRARGVGGFPNAGKPTEDVWDELHDDFQRLALLAEEARQQLSLPLPADPVIPDGQTEEIREVKVRIVQRFFRSCVESAYLGRCAICAASGLPELLIASHIIPWSVDPGRRADPTNGLLLCAIHDRAFDRGLVAVDHNHSILLSPRLAAGSPLAWIDRHFNDFRDAQMNLPSRFHPDPTALAYHLEHIFQP